MLRRFAPRNDDGETCSEKLQILHTAASGGRGVFDRQEQSARHVQPQLSRRRQLAGQPHRVLDRSGDMNISGRIGEPRRGRDSLRVRSLVMRGSRDDRIEGRRQACLLYTSDAADE